MALASLPFGLLIGISLGTLGGGGSVLAVPVLVYVLGQDVHEATTASLAVVTMAALAGGLGHAREGRVCWHHAASLTLAAVPGIVLGTIAGDEVRGTALLAAFALVMLAAAYATWRKAGGSASDSPASARSCPPLRVPRDVAAGLAIGFLTGFFGVGGGFLLVPTLALALAFTMRTAVGTSLAIIAGTSFVGLLVHLTAGRTPDVPVTVAMSLACAGGAVLGVPLARRIQQRALGRAFALLVTAVAAYLLVASALLGGPPAGS